MKDFFRHNGILILIAAILLALVTAVVSMLFGGVADPLSNLVGILTTPVRNGITAVTNWAEEKYNDAFELEQMKEELAGLKQRNAELEAQAREAEAALQENERLRNLLELQPKEWSCDKAAAMVTARSTSNWESTLTIGKGSAAGIAVDEALLPAHLHTDGATGFLCQHYADRCIHQVHLTAKASAQIRCNEPNFGTVQTKQVADEIFQTDAALFRSPNGEFPIEPGGHAAAMRLHGAVMSSGQFILALNDYIGLCKPLVNVTVADLAVDKNVFMLRFQPVDQQGHLLGLVLVNVLMDHNRAVLLECLDRIQDQGFFVLHLNQVQCLFRNQRRCSGHGGHGITHIPDFMLAQYMAILNVAGARFRCICASDNGLNTRQRLCFGGINTFDVPMSDGTAQHSAVEHSVRLDVRGINRLTSYFFICVLADDVLADDLEFRHTRSLLPFRPFAPLGALWHP